MNKKLLTYFVVGMCIMFVSASHAAGNPKAGKIKASTCKTCHGANFEGKKTAPTLAGLDQDYIKKQLNDFKSGARVSATMKMFSDSLDHMDIADLAAYLSSLK